MLILYILNKGQQAFQPCCCWLRVVFFWDAKASLASVRGTILLPIHGGGDMFSVRKCS